MNDELIREIIIGQKSLKKPNELLLKKEIIRLNEEIERLNNIINELEKYFEQEGFWHSLDKVRELKGDSINDKSNN